MGSEVTHTEHLHHINGLRCIINLPYQRMRSKEDLYRYSLSLLQKKNYSKGKQNLDQLVSKVKMVTQRFSPST